MSFGLFHGAIIQSGSALSSWAIQPDPLVQAKAIAQELELNYETTADLVQQLRGVSALDLKENQGNVLSLSVPRGISSSFPFVPSVDPVNYPGIKFLPRPPRELMEQGYFHDIPLIMGLTSEESLFVIREQILDPTVAFRINGNRSLILPVTLWNVDYNSPVAEKITKDLWDFYLNGENLSSDNRFQWSQFCSDAHFNWGIDQSVRLHSKLSSSPVFYYRFSYDGAFGLGKKEHNLEDYPGVPHADDLYYLFNANDPEVTKDDPALVVRERFVKLWTSFAKSGNPTARKVVGQKWNRVGGDDLEFLDMGKELRQRKNPNGERMAMWNSLMVKYGVKGI